MPLITDAALVEQHTLRIYGCTLAEALAANGGEPLRKYGLAASRYCYQRQAAYTRGVEWRITFPQWKAVWDESGKWAERGTGKAGYCMSRRGDVGPYAVGSVFIQPCTQNSREGIERARPAMLQRYQRIASQKLSASAG